MNQKLHKTAAEIRAIAKRLFELAESVETGDATAPPSIRQTMELLALERLAATEYEMRRRREKHLPGNLFREPGWNMLLELFQISGKPLRTTSICIASGAPPTTALRWLGVLEEMRLIKRSAESGDNRATLVSLTPHGRSVMCAIFREVQAQHREAPLLFQSNTGTDEPYITTNRDSES